MNTFQLRSVCIFRRHQFLSILSSKEYHPTNSKHTELKYLCRIPASSFVHSRHFSLAGFYTALSQSTPVLSFQNLLIDLHQSTQLPWWALIGLTTLGIRSLVVFPLAIHQNQVLARLSNINVEIGKLMPELNKEVNIAKHIYKLNEAQAKKAFRKQLRILNNKFVVRDNCHPFKTVLLALFQIPLWICFSVSLRNLTVMAHNMNSASSPVEQLTTEGVLWFPDLTCPDRFIIPLLLMIVNLTLTEVHALRIVGKGTLFQKILVNTSRVVIVVIAVAATVNPSSVSFYWLCSSTFGLGQNLLLMFPKVRRILRIPKTPNESSTPFKDIATNFKKRFQ